MKAITVIRLLLAAGALGLTTTMFLTLLHFVRHGYVLILERGRWMVPAGIAPDPVFRYLDFSIFGLVFLLALISLVYELRQITKW